MKQFDVVAICNALVDILVTADDKDIRELQLTKGRMHLVDEARQDKVLSYLKGKSTTTELGGSSLNAIRTLAALGLKTSFAGMIGKDSFGHLVSQKMSDLGIEAALGESRNDATGTCLILITPDGERTMNTHLGASRLYDEKLVPDAAIRMTKILHFCGYQWDTEGQIRAIVKACQLAKDSGAMVSFDVADPFVVERHKEAFLDLIARDADVVFANKEEAKLLFDGLSPEDAAQAIAEFGAIGVVKKGAEGAVIARGREVVQIAAKKASVVDTTGAGDMFAAGFLYGLSMDKPLATCGEYGAYLAGDVISRTGAVVSPGVIDKIKSLALN